MPLSNYIMFVLLVISYLSIYYTYAGKVEELEVFCIRSIAKLFKIEGVKISVISSEERDLTNLTKEACAKNAIRYLIYDDQGRSVDMNYFLLLRNNLLPGSLEVPPTYCHTNIITNPKSQKQQKIEQKRLKYCIRNLSVFPFESAEKALDIAYWHKNLESFNGTDEENAKGLNFRKYYMEEIINLVQVNPDFDSPELYCKKYGQSHNYVVDSTTGEYLSPHKAERREWRRRERNEIIIKKMENQEKEGIKEMEFSERMNNLQLNEKFGSTSYNPPFEYQEDF